MLTRASLRLRNHSLFKHASRKFPLQLAAAPFGQGWPGSISTVPRPPVASPPLARVGHESRPMIAPDVPRPALGVDEAVEPGDDLVRIHPTAARKRSAHP